MLRASGSHDSEHSLASGSRPGIKEPARETDLKSSHSPRSESFRTESLDHTRREDA
jgi:hypothetical protein